MRILLTGSNGQVGWELARVLPALGEVLATDRQALDLGDPDALRRVVRDAKPDVIVNAAAYTAVDRAESERGPAMRINGEAPGILAEEAKRLGALLVHYSTDYVFDGQKTQPYTEQDEPRPLSVYGETKLAGERAIQGSGCRHVILRASWVYAPRGRNFFLAIAAKARAGESLKVVNDQHGVPTSAGFLAETTRELLARASHAEGLLHAVPAGSTTWFDFAGTIIRQLGARVPLQPVSTEAYGAAAARPRNSVLSNARISLVLGRNAPPWESGLTRCISDYNKNV